MWGDDHLIFANIRLPGTLANLRQNANVEVDVVDPFVRKGYRFKGVASVLESGPVYDKAITSTKSGRAAVRDREKALRLIIRDGTEPAAEEAWILIPTMSSTLWASRPEGIASVPVTSTTCLKMGIRTKCSL